MVRRVVGTLAAASALGAQAFLIPAQVHKDDSKLSPFLAQPLSGDWQTVKLPCSECVLSSPKTEVTEESEGDMPMFIQGGANNLMLNVTTLADRRAIGISGQHTIYPPLEDVNEAVVYIAPSHGSQRQSAKVSGESLLVGEDVVSPEGDVVIQIFYQIQSVDNRPVTVDPIKVTAIKNADNELAIVSVDTVDTGRPSRGPQHMPHTPLPGLEEHLPTEHAPRPLPHKMEKPCTWPGFICQARDYVESKISGLSHSARVGGCGGKAKGMRKMGHHGDKTREGMMALPFGQTDKDVEHHGHHGKDRRPDHETDAKERKPHHGKHHHHDDDDKEDKSFKLDSEGRVREHHHHKGKDGEEFRKADGEGRPRGHNHHEGKDGERMEKADGEGREHGRHHHHDGERMNKADGEGREHGRHHHHDGKDGELEQANTEEGRFRHPKHHHEHKDGMKMSESESDNDDSKAPRPHHRHPHGFRHRHHQSKVQRIVRGALMILTPVFLGITMGMAVSVLGMVVGRLISFLWTRFVRGGKRGYASVQQSEEQAEKAELPPAYQDEDAAVYVVDEKAAVRYTDEAEESN